MPRLHTATSMSSVPVGNWLMLRARRKEIQSPFVLPLAFGAMSILPSV